jgi:hypothetical protein
MITFKKFLEEKRGLWDNIHAKQERIKNGSGEKMRKPGSKGAPTKAAFKASQESFEQAFNMIEEAAKSIDKGEYDYEGQMARTQLQTTLRNCKDMIDMLKDDDNMPEWVQSKITLAQDYITCVRDYLQSKEELGEAANPAQQAAIAIAKKKAGTKPKQTNESLKGGQKKLDKNHNGTLDGQDFAILRNKKTKNEEVEEQFDMIEEVIEELAFINNVDSEILWEKLEELTDEELLEYAIDAKGYKSSTGGLTQKGVNHYRSVTPGSKLQTAVTTPPSKLKPGSKAANRRKSFCARMSGVDGPMKDEKGRPTRKALALRKWNC